MVPCDWTLRALTRNLLTYLQIPTRQETKAEPALAHSLPRPMATIHSHWLLVSHCQHSGLLRSIDLLCYTRWRLWSRSLIVISPWHHDHQPLLLNYRRKPYLVMAFVMVFLCFTFHSMNLRFCSSSDFVYNWIQLRNRITCGEYLYFTLFYIMCTICIVIYALYALA